jgi:ATP-dependent DNA helicase RecG
MQYLHQNGKITNREYRQLSGISEATGLRDFELLVERGVIKAVGKGRSRHYTLP